jgi:Arc/MetJ-type ribon-helix-helix transcriptional regulator
MRVPTNPETLGQLLQAAEESAPAVRRVNVNFSEPVYRMLEQLAKRRGTSMAEVLRDAIALEAWVEKERERGSRIMAQRDGDDLPTELVFR